MDFSGELFFKTNNLNACERNRRKESRWNLGKYFVKGQVGIKRCFVVSKFRALLWKDG
jgi:hypothetical protein